MTSGSWRAAPEVQAVEAGGDAFLLDGRSGESFHLNATGARLWSELVNGRSCEQAADKVAAAAGAAREVVYRDARALVEALVEAGLLTAVADGPTGNGPNG